MAQRVKVLRAGYPYWEGGVQRKAKRDQEIVLHAHLAHVDHLDGKVRILGRHIPSGTGTSPGAQLGSEPKRRGRPPGSKNKKGGFLGIGGSAE